MSQKPTIILVPGAWHVPAHYTPLTSRLKEAGYKTVSVRTVSPRDTPPYTVGQERDTGAVTSAILTELDEGNEVIVLMHSYGGVPGSNAIEGLRKEDLAKKGLKGGVVHLIYMTAMALEEGFGWVDFQGTVVPSLEKKHKIQYEAEFQVDVENDLLHFSNAGDVLYNGVPKELVEKSVALMKPWGLRTNASPAKYPAWKHVDSTYLICEDDQIITWGEQEWMSSQPGTRITQRSLGMVGHSPFASHPEETAKVVLEIAGKYTS